MRYDFIIAGDVPAAIGQVDGSDPRDAVLNAIRSTTDVLDECEGALAPDITITRTGDKTFVADVCTHGLGDLAVRVVRADPA